MTIAITADMREGRSSIIKQLQANPDVSVDVRDLPCGDYLIREDIAVERKAAVDFVASILDNRLFSQVARMKAEFGRSIFIIEGDIFHTRSAINPDALRGAISYLVAIEGASIVPSTGPGETASLLATMARHAQQGLGYALPLRTQKPKDVQLLARFVVEGFPGIGSKTAQALLQHFGSVQAIMAADVAQLKQAPGIGDKTARGIRSVMESVCN